MPDLAQVGPFVLGDRIGRGGMGAVYRARHQETGQTVAIEVLLADIVGEAHKRRRFRSEVQALAKLHHPAVAAILDFGEIDSRVAERGPVEFVADAP